MQKRRINHKVTLQKREARLLVVAELYKKGYSIREIAREVKERLNLPKTPSTRTIHLDIKLLLKEWREERIENVDELIELELGRIDTACRELWQEWEKSKHDYERTTRSKQKNSLMDELGEELGDKESITTTEIKGFGNATYITEIRNQLMERRKLLGLYAPEKREFSGKLGLENLEDKELDASIEDLKAKLDD